MKLNSYQNRNEFKKDVTSILHMTEWGEFTHNVYDTIEQAAESLAKLFKNNKRSQATVRLYKDGRSYITSIGYGTLVQDSNVLLEHFKWHRYFNLGWTGMRFLTVEEQKVLWSISKAELEEHHRMIINT